MDVIWWAKAAVVAMAVGQTAFVLLYASVKWWRDPVGVALFAASVTLMVLVDASVVSLFFTVSMWIALGIYWLVVAGIWLQFLIAARERGFLSRLAALIRRRIGRS